jgi:hypothetical protein
MVALRKVWAVMDASASKRPAPFLPEIVARLRACGELDIDDATAASLCAMSAARSTGGWPVTGRNWSCGAGRAPSRARC